MLGWEFPPYFAGGVGVVAHGLTKALKGRNVDVTYIMPSGPATVHGDFVNLLVADNLVSDNDVDVIRVGSLLTPYTSLEQYRQQYNALLANGMPSSLYSDNLLTEMELFSQKVLRIVQERHLDFDVIHAHDWTTFPAALALQEATGKPLLVHVHITEFDKTGGEHADPRVYAIEQAGMRGANLVIAVSNKVKDRCVYQYHIPEEKIRVVYNAVEFTTKPTAHEEFHLKEQDKVVLFLGRVTLQKGPDYFLEAARKVVDLDPNVKFIIAGTGDMLTPMIERAAALGLSNKVIFTGFVSREQGDKLYRMADVFVMPSVSEPFGIVPLESMYQGTPVIISKQSGVSEVLRNALKVDFWNVDDIANKILAALSYPVLHQHLRDEGSAEVSRFNWSVPAAKVEQIYHEVAGW